MAAAFVWRDNIRHRRSIEGLLVSACAQARERIDIVCPYFYPGIALRRALPSSRGIDAGASISPFARRSLAMSSGLFVSPRDRLSRRTTQIATATTAAQKSTIVTSITVLTK